jgi:DNA-binding NarL/FixJ family response regulator
MPIAKIVVVDDDADFRQLLVTLVQLDPRLRVSGQASDGETALELVRREAPSLVLMDLMMPRLDGLEATRRIKRVVPDIKVIILSSVADPQHRRLAYDSGADVFVDKRDMVTTLLATIRTLVPRTEEAGTD